MTPSSQAAFGPHDDPDWEADEPAWPDDEGWVPKSDREAENRPPIGSFEAEMEELRERMLDEGIAKPVAYDDWAPPSQPERAGPSRRQGTRQPARQDSPQNGHPAEFLSVKEAAEIIRLSEKFIRRAIKDGELRASKPRGRIRIKRADLYAWLEASLVEPSVHDIEPWR